MVARGEDFNVVGQLESKAATRPSQNSKSARAYVPKMTNDGERLAISTRHEGNDARHHGLLSRLSFSLCTFWQRDSLPRRARSGLPEPH